MVGRGLRPFNNKKEAIIVDHGGNVKRHGFAEDKHEYTLEDGLIVSGKKDKDSLHTCKNCLAVFLGDCCPACNKMREKTTIEIHEEKKELVELKRVQMTSDERKKEYDKIVSWAKWKGYSPKVVFGRYVGTFHTSPDREWSKGVIGWKSGGPIWL
jgi:superfamily II DNA or RNA helicase